MSDVNPCTSDDFWFEVLKKLPVKALGKCRCVCKSWHSLIISPSFMTAHFKNYTQNQANSLLLCREDIPPQFPTTRTLEKYAFFAQGDDKLEASHTSSFPFSARGLFGFRIHFVGSVYGLVCLAHNAYITRTSCALIWNPLLQKCILLPASYAASDVMGETTTSVLGFGYDGKRNDHRVVRISYLKGNEGLETPSPFAEVFSVQERTWRAISADLLVDKFSDHMVGASHCFFNGVLHWVTWKAVLSNWLLSFNVSEEQFGRMKLPEALVKKPPSNCGLFEFRSKLSMSYCEISVDGFSYWCRIWVKGEYNVDSSWQMIVDVILNNSVIPGVVEYLTSNGEIVGFDNQSDGELVAYDPKTKRTKSLGLCQSVCNKFCAYTESLVLLDHKSDVGVLDELQRSADDHNKQLVASTNLIANMDLFEFEEDLFDIEDDQY